MDPAAMAGWDAYFEHVHTNPVSSECSRLRGQITERSAGRRAAFGAKVNFQVTDIRAGSPSTTVIQGPNAAKDLKTVLSSDDWQKSKGLRLISLVCKRTVMPLEISSTLAADIFSRYRIAPEFLRALLSFGREPLQSEARNSFISSQVAENGDAVFSYKLNYFEKNDHGTWTSRHIGAYHHHTSSGADLFILATGQRQTSFYSTLVELGIIQPEDGDGASSSTSSSASGPAPPDAKAARHLQTNPASLHAALLSCYVDRWRDYMTSLGDEFNGIANRAFGATSHAIGEDTIRNVQTLRNLYDLSLFAGAACASNVDVAEALVTQLAPLLGDAETRSLKSSADVLKGLSGSCYVLQEKIKNVTDLVGYSIRFHHQLETAKLEKEVRDMTARMASLTEENRDLTKRLGTLAEETSDMTRKLQELTQNTASDGAIVSVITIVSAVYLPGSFVATIFGMNFFDFDGGENSRYGIQIADGFWIFVLLWFFFMAVTGGVFWAVYRMKGSNMSWSWKKLKNAGNGTPRLAIGGGKGTV